MRWIMLFEGFKEDFYKSKEEIESKYNKEMEDLLKETKWVVDQLMYGVTDDYSYQTKFSNDSIDSDELVLYYHLKCDAQDIDKFLKRLKSVASEIESQFELNMTISGRIWRDTFSSEINFGFNMTIDRMMEWLDRYFHGYRDDIKSQYTSFTFTATFS